jgi:hypothetical protein
LPGPARSLARAVSSSSGADVAQLVEHFTRNEGVRGSSPRVGFTRRKSLAERARLSAVMALRCETPLLWSVVSSAPRERSELTVGVLRCPN